MKTKLVNRYYCDFCKKANCSASSMTKHERGCTNNPNRICGICKTVENKQPSMETLLAALRADIALGERTYSDEGGGMAIYELQIAANDCPACILAAIRQVKTDFHFNYDFASELKAYWQHQNEALELR